MMVKWLRSLGFMLIGTVFLCACSQMDVKPEVVAQTETARKGPQDTPRRNITGFSDGLRCMDNTLLFYGVRDVSALVEDLPDQTKKINAGTKDMLISAISDMTARSRALRLVTFGVDSGNLANFLANAETKVAYSVLPQYDIRGSITQLDDSLVKKSNEGSITISGFGLGSAKSAQSSIVGLDLNVISTKDYSVVPGVSARNSVAVFKEGSGIDAEAEYKKFGISYGQSLTKSEGQTQALRSLVELAAIEIVGKLTRTPYWKCLNADRSNPDIANEIANWLYTMSVDHQLVPYMQKQLRLRNYYTGPVDGVVNDELLAAVARSHGDLGLPASSDVDLTYFSAFLDSTHVAERQQAAVARPTPLRLTIASDHRPGEMKKGQVYALQIRPSRDAHVYCYLQDDDGNIQRFYPNRFAQDSLVKADSGLELPGHMRFQLVASQKGGPETVACFAAERDVLSAVPATISGTDFVSIGARSMNEVHGAFAAAASGNLGEAYFNVKPN